MKNNYSTEYEIMQNANGDIVLLICDTYEGEPDDNARLVYDGKDVALLYRSWETSIAFRNINKQAGQALKNAKTIKIIEVKDEENLIEYNAVVDQINDVSKLIF